VLDQPNMTCLQPLRRLLKNRGIVKDGRAVVLACPYLDQLFERIQVDLAAARIEYVETIDRQGRVRPSAIQVRGQHHRPVTTQRRIDTDHVRAARPRFDIAVQCHARRHIVRIEEPVLGLTPTVLKQPCKRRHRKIPLRLRDLGRIHPRRRPERHRHPPRCLTFRPIEHSLRPMPR
jgi:hypothetical protein